MIHQKNTTGNGLASAPGDVPRSIRKKPGYFSIGTQIRIGFYCDILLIAILGTVVFFQIDSIWQGTKGLYEHPLTVRRALGEAKCDILNIQHGMKDVVLTTSSQERMEIMQSIDAAEIDALKQFAVLYERYLGPRKDLDAAHSEFVKWKSICSEIVRLVQNGQLVDAQAILRPNGAGGMQVKNLMERFAVIDVFAHNRGDAFFKEARKQKDRLTAFLGILVAIILLFSIGIITFILNRLNAPLAELTRAAQGFTKGDLSARSAYAENNEFGLLSETFNDMAHMVQMNMAQNEKAAHLASVMLGEDDAKKFFRSILGALMAHTGSQVAAAYLLSENKKEFELLESIGLGSNMRQSFSAEYSEGEFGAVLSSRKIVHIKNVPNESKLLVNMVSGTFVPREIITIPIVLGIEVVAVVSISSITGYDTQTVQLIEKVLNMLGARVEGILAYRKMKEFSEQLKGQNRELQAQQNELAAQSNELTVQNRELEQQKQQLADASRLKTTFLSNMSHELRTPLNSVIALSGVLSRRLVGKLSNEEYSYLEVIERNGKMLLTLINDILDISRIEAGREEVEIARFAVDDLVADVVAMLAPQAEAKNIHLLHHKDGVAVLLESDLDKCRHILLNMIGNAVKFTEAGSVEIRICSTDAGVNITVADTGIGIAEDQIPYIFDEFRQADGSTSRRFGGTGLGLAIAKKYASLLGGTISVESVPKEGSVFTLHLPQYATSGKAELVVPRAELRHSRDEHSDIVQYSGATIMLVEDSEPAIIQLTDILKEQGYRIITARGGKEAIDMLDKEKPDAIILDLMMPGVDGFTVLKTVRDEERTAHVPVLILTAKHITKEELKYLKRNNIHQLIQKGDVNRTELLYAVAAMVKRSEIAITLQKKTTPQIITGKPVVLVVEDNPDNMLTLRALLAEEYTILEATDGESGVAAAIMSKPHVILMDISLPGKDGIAAFKQIRSNTETMHIPVVAVTASAMTSDRETILAYGFDDYVAKPIDIPSLHVCLRRVLYGT